MEANFIVAQDTSEKRNVEHLLVVLDCLFQTYKAYNVVAKNDAAMSRLAVYLTLFRTQCAEGLVSNSLRSGEAVMSTSLMENSLKGFTSRSGIA